MCHVWEVREVEWEDVNQSSKFAGEYLRGYLLKLSRILWASGKNAFHALSFLFAGNKVHPASEIFPEFQRADPNSC